MQDPYFKLFSYNQSNHNLIQAKIKFLNKLKTLFKIYIWKGMFSV